MLQKYTKGNLEVLHTFIERRITMLEQDRAETKDAYSVLPSRFYRERLNRLDDEMSFLEDLTEIIEDMLERGEGR